VLGGHNRDPGTRVGEENLSGHADNNVQKAGIAKNLSPLMEGQKLL
jgi:hypothetical protein